MKLNNKIFLMFLFGIFLISFTSAALTDNLVSYYKLDETTGTTAYDSTGKYNGTIDGATVNQTGKIGQAYSFDGVNDYIEIAGIGTALSNFTTFSAWFKTTQSGGYLFDNRYTTGGDSDRGLAITNSTHMYFARYSSADGSFYFSAPNANDGNWHHVVIFENSTGGYAYFDGQYKSTRAVALTYSNLVTRTLKLGVKYNNAAFENYFNGTIDEVSIYNRSLSQSEITELYNNGTGLSYPFTITTKVEINLTYPTNNSQIITEGENFSASYNILDNTYNYTWRNATYYVWYSNGTLLNQTTINLNNTNITNSTQFIDNFILGNYLWNVKAYYANNTYSNYTWGKDGNYTFEYRPFLETAYLFNNSVLETSRQRYMLNITSIETVNSFVSKFYYNGTEYNPTTTDFGSGKYGLNNYIDVPLQNSIGNKTFYWYFNFTLNDGSSFEINSTEYSQEVNRTILTYCNSTYTTKFINFTTKDAENPFPIINASFKSAWKWYVKGGNGTVYRDYSFEDVTESKSNFTFCSNYNTTYIVDADIEFDEASHSQNYYYLDNAELSNITQNISLYLINESKATITVLKVRDQIQNPIEDVLIQIQLYDVGTDAYYLVGMAKTSFNGEDVVYLNWYDSLYKFILIKNGEIIKSTNVTKIAETPQIFDILPTTTYSFEKFRDFDYNLYFNNATNNFILTFTKPSGLVEQGCLRVIKRSSTNDTEICNQCESSASATLYCNLNGYGNGTYIAAFYATGSWYLLDISVHTIGKKFAEEINDLLDSEDASFYSFLMGLLVVCLFLVNIALGIIGVLLGLLASSALGFVVLDYITFMTIAIIGGVIIWIIKR